MFTITDAQAAIIRTTYEERGELSAAVELRRLFPGIASIKTARGCLRTVIGWKALPVAMVTDSRCGQAAASKV